MVEKLFGSFLGGIAGEMRMHPWTSLASLLSLVAVAVFLLFNPLDHASASEVSGLKTELTKLTAAVTEQKGQVQEILAGQIEVKLVEAQVRYCDAREESNDTQIHYYRGLVQDYTARYRNLTLREVSVPSCQEV